jgi:hypothetical protein
MSETDLNTIFEQDGVIYAVGSHNMPAADLAKFISRELRYAAKRVPRYQMRIVTTEVVRTMPFGKPSHDDRPNKKAEWAK